MTIHLKITLLFVCLHLNFNYLNGQNNDVLNGFYDNLDLKSRVIIIGVKKFEHPVLCWFKIKHIKGFDSWKELHGLIMEKDKLNFVNKKNIDNLIYNDNYYYLANTDFVERYFLSWKTISDYRKYGECDKDVIFPIDSLYFTGCVDYNSEIFLSKEKSYLELKTNSFLVVLVNHIWFNSILPMYQTDYSMVAVCFKHDKSYRDALYIKILIPLYEEEN
jgi:hypothetical protein